MAEMLKETLLNTLPTTKNNTDFEIRYCPKCGEPITKVIELLGKKRLVPVACKCKALELEKFKARLEYNEKKDTLDRVFGTRLSTRNTKDISFENWNDDLGNIELKTFGVKYCNSFENKFKGNIGFNLNGKAGVGKSYLSLCIAKDIERRGYTVLAITISEILDKLKESYNSNKSNRETQLNRMLIAINSADLLILDDLGVEPPSSWVNNVIYRLVDSRYMNKKPLIITTNLEDFSRYDEKGRIDSRLSEMCKPINVTGDDIRKVKAKVKGMDIEEVIGSSLNALNNKDKDKPNTNNLKDDEEGKIDFKRQVVLSLSSYKNIFGQQAITEFSNKDIEYIVNRIESATNKIQLLNGFINIVRNNSKSTKLREFALDYLKFSN